MGDSVFPVSVCMCLHICLFQEPSERRSPNSQKLITERTSSTDYFLVLTQFKMAAITNRLQQTHQ